MQEDPTDRQRRVWDAAASAYDRQMDLTDRLWFGDGREWLTSRAHGRVLEVAVGTGRTLGTYAEATHLTGVDLSGAMLDLARDRARSLGRQVDLWRADAQALPFDDGSFDTVVCALALCSVPDPVVALREMHRVLVPGGTLLLLDHVGSTLAPLRWAQWLVERVTVRTAGEHFTRRQRPLLHGIGFEVLETERLKLGTVERVRAIASAELEAP